MISPVLRGLSTIGRASLKFFSMEQKDPWMLRATSFGWWVLVILIVADTWFLFEAWYW